MFEAFPLDLPADHPYAPKPVFAGPTVTEISVPSGQLIVSDDLRKTKRYDLDPRQSINYGAGCDAYAHLFADEVNMAYASVGNTCPRVTRGADGSIQIVRPDWTRETGSIFEAGEEEIFTICTDHWAAMLVDYQEWLNSGADDVETANKEFSTESFKVIDVTPGKYRWTVYSHRDDFDTDASGRVIFAKLELIESFKTS